MDFTKFPKQQLTAPQQKERDIQADMDRRAEEAQQEWNRKNIHPVKRKLLPPVLGK